MKPIATVKTKQRKLNRVPLQYSIHWQYLKQDQAKYWYEIWKLPAYRKYSKATICRHMIKPIADIVIDKRKQSKGRPPTFSERDRGNIAK